MSDTWSISTGRTRLAFRANEDGDVLADDVLLTHLKGWLDVRVLSSALARGAPPIVSLRMQVAHDVDGHVELRIGEVVVRGRRHPSVRAIEEPWAEFWRATLADAVYAEINRRVADHKPTVRLRATPRAHPSPTDPASDR